jgi:hypothetical protein
MSDKPGEIEQYLMDHFGVTRAQAEEASKKAVAQLAQEIEADLFKMLVVPQPSTCKVI